MFQFAAKKGPRVIKILGILTLIGVIIAIGRIILKVFNEKNPESDEGHNGI